MANIGSDFIVNTTTVNSQFEPTVAALPDGRFVVTWYSYDGGDGSSTTIRARLYDANGTAAGNDFIVNTTTASDPVQPTVAALPDGRFVVTWYSYDGGDGSGTTIRARLYDANGTAAGNDFIVNTTTASDQYLPTVAALPDGRFVVTWYSYDGGDGSGTAIRARLYANGTAAGVDFIVNTTAASDQFQPTVAALPDGRFVVTWYSYDGGDGSGTTIRARLYDANGSAVGNDFVINTTAASDQVQPTVAALPDGRFVVTWYSYDGGDGSGTAIRARLYAANGTAAGNDFLVNTTTANGQFEPTVAALPDGRFVVTWHSLDGGDGSSTTIRARLYDANGTAAGDDFIVNTTTANNQSEPTVAALPDGRVVVTWYSFDGGDGSGTTIRARILDFNHAPTVSGTPAVTTAEDTAYPFTLADFNFADADAGDTLQSVTIVTLSTDGTLFYDANGGSAHDAVMVTEDQVVSAADIAAGKLLFVPGEDENGANYATFTYTVNDGECSSPAATMSVTVNPVNDAPVPFTIGDDNLELPVEGGTFDALAGNDIVRYAAGTTGMVTFNGNTGIDTFCFQLLGSAVWVDLAYTGTPNEAWTQDDVDLLGGTWREIADLTNVENLVGTSHADKLYGDGSNNRLTGGAGNDLLTGRGGTDTAVFTGHINDYVFNHLANGDIEVIDQRAGSPDGTDTLTGIEMMSFTNGEFATGLFTEGSDIATLPVGGGTLNGGSGNDLARYAAGTTGGVTFNGGSGTDAFSFELFGAAVWVDLTFTSTPNEAWTQDNTNLVVGSWREIADISNTENLIGTAHADKLYGDGANNRLTGGGGNDLLTGRGGIDAAVFSGALSNYSIVHLANGDIQVIDQRAGSPDGTDTLTGIEMLAFSNGDFTVGAFTEGNDVATLPVGGGTFNALGGNDSVSYAAGTAGAVTIDGGGGTDMISFALFGSAVWVDLAYTGTPNEAWTRDTTNLNSGTYREIANLDNVENLTGTVHSDKMWGNGADNTFLYNGGLDAYDGRGGNDTVNFSLFGSAVWVDLQFVGTANEAWTRDNAGVTTGTWREIADLTAIENVTGTNAADQLFGNAGVNRLEGGAGNDQLTGRSGNDIFVFRTGFGADTITDFTGAGATVGDQIELSLGTPFDTFAEVQAVASVSGGNTVLNFGGGNTLTLTGVTTALHQNDFLFV